MVAPRLAALGALLSLLTVANGRTTTVPLKKNFIPLRPVASDSTVTLTLTLPSSDIDGLHTKLADVSDPTSANYGKWLSKEEVQSYVAPKMESVQAVNSWLAQYSLTAESASPAGELLRINVPAHLANQMFAANFTEYNETTSATTQIGTLSYTIPDEVSDHVTLIFPTTQFIPPVPKGQKIMEAVRAPSKRTTAPANCSTDIYPECLSDLYNLPLQTTAAPGNAFASAQWLNDMATEADLEIFFSQYRPDVKVPQFSISSVDGGITSGGLNGYEANLDTQYLLGLAPAIPYTLISNGNAFLQGFIDLANAVAADANPPPVLSISWGFDEYEFIDSQDMANQLCDSLAAATARGVSIFFCAGDNGVWGFGYESVCNATSTSPYSPTFPSGCPYVTSVGGTLSIPETAASFGGGGFSNIFTRPSYQDSTVESYIAGLNGQSEGLYNASGRAYPDVSAQSWNFHTIVGGANFTNFGTSASTPSFAAVIALVNDQRLAAGKSVLGFLNPLLYANPSALNDITTGNNSGCPGVGGFPAVEGWDPATGLGTPNYETLLSLAMSLP